MVLLEVCVDSLEALALAQTRGAGRIELCARLDLDGLSPTAEVLERALEIARVPVFVMVRPSPGTFVVSHADRATMRREIEAVKRAGAGGVVLGAITECGDVDAALVRELVAVARPLQVTFHRAFDRVRDRTRALDALLELGIDRVLTSGGAPDAESGIPALKELVERARRRIIVMAGGRVRAHNAARIVRETGVFEIHGSVPFEIGASAPERT